MICITFYTNTTKMNRERGFMAKDKKNPKGKYAWTATVGEKGQIVIPKQAREIFNINPGDTIIILGDEKKGIAIPPANILTKLGAFVFPEAEETEEE